MKIALVSLDQAWQDKNANLKKCELYIKKASDSKVNLVVFPEMTLTGFSPASVSIVEYSFNSQTFEWFGSLAKQYSINIIFGACLKDGDRGPFNMLCLADRDGHVKSLYAKTHLFSYANEDEHLVRGNKIINHKINDINFGFAICYDLRFPELFSIMASDDCEAIIVIANWPAVRSDHWRTLLKARAIENECIVFGVNRTGRDGNGVEYERGSIMVAPDGSIQKPINSFSLLDIYNVEKHQTQTYRNTFPTIQDKRYSLYKQYFLNLI